MTNPLVRPPIAPHSFKWLGGERAPAPVSNSVSKFWAELRDFVADTDPRRVAWATTRLLPDFTFPTARARALSALGCRLERGIAVMGYVSIVGPRDAASNLRIGSGCVIGPRATLCLDAPITLGRNVSIGPYAKLYTASHALGAESRRMQLSITARPIVIDDGVWIGLAAIVLGGVRIGKGSVVAAGAVVNEDVPENVLVEGNPASIVQSLPTG